MSNLKHITDPELDRYKPREKIYAGTKGGKRYL